MPLPPGWSSRSLFEGPYIDLAVRLLHQPRLDISATPATPPTTPDIQGHKNMPTTIDPNKFAAGLDNRELIMATELAERLRLVEWLSILFDDSERNINGGELVASLAEFFQLERGGPPSVSKGDDLPNGNYYDPTVIRPTYHEFVALMGEALGFDQLDKDDILNIFDKAPGRRADLIMGADGVNTVPEPPGPLTFEEVVNIINKATGNSVEIHRRTTYWDVNVMVDGRVNQTFYDAQGDTALEAARNLYIKVKAYASVEAGHAQLDANRMHAQLNLLGTVPAWEPTASGDEVPY